jgi:hypothetical protein
MTTNITETQMNNTNEIRNCPRCKGAGEVEDHFKGGMRECLNCKGARTYTGFDVTALVSAICATKGKNKGKIRASMTSTFSGDQNARRAYYVWRLARFHGGADVTQPMMADLALGSDPFKPELDQLADIVAKEQFGSNMRAALVWGRALGMI